MRTRARQGSFGKNGETALHMAARNGSHRLVKALATRDPGLVFIIDKKGQATLYIVVKSRSPNAVGGYLFTDLSIFNVHDRKGNITLHISTRNWRPQMVGLLLSYESIEVTINNKINCIGFSRKNPFT